MKPYVIFHVGNKKNGSVMKAELGRNQVLIKMSIKDLCLAQWANSLIYQLWIFICSIIYLF